MHLRKIAILSALLMLIVSSATAKDDGVVECKHGEDHREIVNNKPPTGGCKVEYRRPSGSTTVAQANNDLSYCKKISKQIQSNLESAGFECTR